MLDARSEYPEAKSIVIDCQGINSIDASGVAVIESLVSNLRAEGTTLFFVHMKHPVIAVLKRSGVFESIGEDCFFHRLDDIPRPII